MRAFMTMLAVAFVATVLAALTGALATADAISPAIASISVVAPVPPVPPVSPVPPSPPSGCVCHSQSVAPSTGVSTVAPANGTSAVTVLPTGVPLAETGVSIDAQVLGASLAILAGAALVWRAGGERRALRRQH
jgi:hypothetical protein